MTARFLPAGRSMARLALALAATSPLCCSGPPLPMPGKASNFRNDAERNAGRWASGRDDQDEMGKQRGSRRNPGGPSNPCNCDDPKYIEQHFPTGFIGNPHATAICEIVEFSFGRCPPGSQVGTVEPLFGFASRSSTSSHTPRNLAHRVLGATGAGAGVHQPLGPDRERLRARRRKLARLPPASDSGAQVTLWGVPADEQDFGERFMSPLKGFGDLLHHPDLRGGRRNRRQRQRAAGALPRGSDHLRSAAGRQCDAPYYTHGIVQAGRPMANDDRLRAPDVQPQPHRRADDKQADCPAGVNIDLKVPQEQSPTTPSPSEIKETTITLPEGLLDQLQRGRRQGHMLGRRHHDRHPRSCDLPRILEDRHAQPRQLGAAGTDSGLDLPGRPEARRPLPDPARGERLRNPLQARRAPSSPTRRRAAGRQVRGPAAEPADRVQHALLRLRARPAGDTDPVRHLSGRKRIRAVGRRPAQPDLDSVTSRRQRARRRACPNGPRPFSPQFAGGDQQHHRRRSARSRSSSPAATGEQNLAASTRRAPRASAQPSRASPTAPRLRLAAHRGSATRGLAEIAAPTCPAVEPDRHVDGRRRRGQSSGLPAGRVYLAGPYKGAPAQHCRRDAGRLRSLRPRQRRRQGGDQCRSRDDPGDAAPTRCRRSSEAFPCGCGDPDQPQPARLHAQPDQLRPVRPRHDDRRRPKARSSTSDGPLPGRELLEPRLQAESRA